MCTSLSFLRNHSSSSNPKSSKISGFPSAPLSTPPSTCHKFYPAPSRISCGKGAGFIWKQGFQNHDCMKKSGHPNSFRTRFSKDIVAEVLFPVRQTGKVRSEEHTSELQSQ